MRDPDRDPRFAPITVTKQWRAAAIAARQR
jgi:hypothetical protein